MMSSIISLCAHRVNHRLPPFGMFFWLYRYMNKARGIACDNSGQRVFVTGMNPSNSIAVLDVSNSTNPTFIVGKQGPPLNNPMGIAYDPIDGRLFVASSGMNALAIFDVRNSSSALARPPILDGNVTSATYMKSPRAVAHYSSQDLVFVSGHDSHSVCAVDVASYSGPLVIDGLNSTSSMRGATGVAFDPTTKLAFVAGSLSNSLAVVRVNGSQAIPTGAPSPPPTSLPTASPTPQPSLSPTLQPS